MEIIVQFLIALAINVVAHLITPKPRGPQAADAPKLEDPTAEAGRPVGIVFGTVIRKSPNTLWFGDKSTDSYQIKV